jgi:WD40 repeat protein
VLLWDTGDLKKPSVLKKPTTVHPALWDDTHHVFRCLAFSPDSRLLVGAGPCVQFWDVAGVQPKEKTTIERPKNSSVWSMAFSPDGKTLAINGDAADGWDTRLLDLLPDKPKERARLAQIRPFSQFAFSPDGKCLACVGWTEGPPQRGLQLPVDVVTIWDVATGKERARIKGFGVVDHMAYSPDGHALAVGLDYLTNKETLRLYDIRGDQPKQLAVLPGHKKGVRFVGFLPDAKSLVSVGFDGHIILWDISPGKMVALQDWESATPASVMHVALAADGRHLAVACRHNTVQIMRIR